MNKWWYLIGLWCVLCLPLQAKETMSEMDNKDLEWLNEMIDVHHLDVFENRGLLYYKYKMYSLAISDFTQAINNKFLSAYYNRGLCYLNLKQYKLALQDFDSVLEKDLHHYNALINRGFIYHRMEKYTFALRDFSTVINIYRNDEYAHYLRGLSYYALELYQASKADLIQACNKGYEEACESLAPEYWVEPQ